MLRRRLAVVALITLGSLAYGSTVALAGGGASGIAKMCQKGGWQSLQTSSGGGFAGQDSCVSYGATGGTLRAPTLTATDDGCSPVNGSVYDKWAVAATGFTPNSSLSIVGGLSGFTLDASGDATVYFFFPPSHAGSQISVTMVDGSGVHASVTVGPSVGCREPAATVTHNGCTIEPGTGDVVDQWVFDLTGFTANSSLAVTLNGSPYPVSIPLDSSGSATYDFNLLGSAGGVMFTIAFTDGSGLTTSVVFGPTASC